VVQSESLFVQAVTLFDLVKRMLLERAFDVEQYVVHMMLIWSPRVELEGKVEGSVSMRNERVEDIGNKVYGRGLFRIVVGKRQTKP